MATESGSSLPENMTAQTLTKLKSNGWLKWASVELFNLLTIVEKTVINYVKEGLIFIRDAFEAILKELEFAAILNLLQKSFSSSCFCDSSALRNARASKKRNC